MSQNAQSIPRNTYQLYPHIRPLHKYLESSCLFKQYYDILSGRCSALMVSALIPEQAVWVWALARETALCSWARYLTLTVPLSTQEYNGYRQIVGGKPNRLWGNDLQWTSILSRGSRNTPSRFMLQKLGISSGSYDPVGSKASFFLWYFKILGIHVFRTIHSIFGLALCFLG